MSEEPSDSRISRRALLTGAASLAGTVAVGGGVYVLGDGEVLRAPRLSERRTEVTVPQTDGPRRWLGPELWGNRLQDWQVADGRVECLRGEAGFELRTASLLTREIVAGEDAAHLRVRTGIAEGKDGAGFAGLLIGAGSRDLHHRAAALVQRGGGAGGGLLCTYETDGRVRIRDHTDGDNPLEYRPLSVERPTDTSGSPRPDAGSVRLSVDVLPRSDGSFDVHVEAIDAESGRVRSSAVRRGVAEETVLGGVSLASSPLPGQDGPRWWFEKIETVGGKVATRPERTFGPIAGTLYSLNGSVLKLSAHLLPMGASDPETVTLRYRPADGSTSWRTERATVGPGHTALFRVEDWNRDRNWAYQVRYRDGTGAEWQYEGRIRRDPVDAEELTVGLLSCLTPCGRRLDSGKPRETPPSEAPLPGRYTPENIYFPYETLTANLAAQDPDLLVATGDQVYEPKPTEPAGREDPALDYLYKWYLWLWSFRDLTRDRPTVLLVDDHDVFQPNIWGSGGEETSIGRLKRGGYVAAREFVNRVQRIQCGHNPDPYDPTPAERGIDVYYGGFTYGGARFAVLEDRKFKTGPAEKERVLLGDRQARFLQDWADGSDDGSVQIALTQTSLAAALTTPERELVSPDRNASQAYDTNGYPKEGRDRAVRLLREAGALVLSGDLHLPMLLRHGLDAHTDGVVQFVGPGGAADYPRWFEPETSLPDGRGHPYTGTFTDGVGNKARMLAVANPDISHETYERTRKGLLYDRTLRSDGYGMITVDFDDEAFELECWPWDADPTAADAEQFRGWPYRLGFDEVRGRRD